MKSRKRNIRPARVGFVFLVCVWTVACGKVIPVHYYDIRFPMEPTQTNAPKHAATLAIANFTASSIYRQSRILYREGIESAKVGFYDDRRWISPPTELLSQAAILHFRNSNLFSNVIPYSSGSRADFILRGRITELEEVDLSDGYYGKITVFAEFIEAEEGRILWSGPVRASRKTTIRNVDAIVDEIVLGVKEVLQSLARSVDQAVSERQPAP